jgi:hypothetical protein
MYLGYYTNAKKTEFIAREFLEDECSYFDRSQIEHFLKSASWDFERVKEIVTGIERYGKGKDLSILKMHINKVPLIAHSYGPKLIHERIYADSSDSEIRDLLSEGKDVYVYFEARSENNSKIKGILSRSSKEVRWLEGRNPSLWTRVDLYLYENPAEWSYIHLDYTLTGESGVPDRIIYHQTLTVVPNFEGY